MKRYRQPKAGTDANKKQIEFENTKTWVKASGILESLQHIYKGELKNEWQ